jgi:arylsulfatase A-like enzyme
LAAKPNIVLLITDQQRRPRHWPDEAGWLSQLMPNDAELARTGITFTNGFCNTAMCSPSRATLFTGLYPAEHGVMLTLTQADLRPNPRHAPDTMRTLVDLLRSGVVPRGRLMKQFARGLFRLDQSAGGEKVLPPEIPNLPRILRSAGYEVAYKGKWHLTHPSGEKGGQGLLGGWMPGDADVLARDYGFADWEVPDAGENAEAKHFGGGNAGEGEGWDEVYIRQVERWLGRENLPEPFCLVVSLVNPHDVLGYPASYEAGGYSTSEFRDLGVELPPTVDEDLRGKPSVHALMRMGMTAYLGALRDRRMQLDYVNFYAHLHRVIDEKIGRLLGALGDAGDPESLRSRTVVMRCADHGEMGLSHGGLRQKAFNAYEETINIPIVVSNPVLFPEPVSSDALVSLIDLLPTIATLGGADTSAAALKGRDLTPLLARHANPQREALAAAAVDLGPVTEHAAPADSVQDAIHFTYDDHQAGTATREAPGQPNRVRAVRTATGKYAVYIDPTAERPSEYEMYDLDRDPNEVDNLLGVADGKPFDGRDRAGLDELRERLQVESERCATTIRPG